MSSNLRVGIGYDVHPLAPGRRLVLGGVEIPFARGLGGWSDADSLTHAVIGALLGAAGLEDIGAHFPPGDPRYKDISSLVLLGKVKEELAESGWQVVNIDATILADKPRMRDFIDPMRRQLSETLGISISRVGLKATTSNGLGFIGRGEGIAVYAVALLEGGKDEDI
jgi:2-C-methyl-D-erythritol 2,4-cyclodiphosphate synthase